MSLGERIKKVRGNLSQAEFIRRLKIHRNTLPRYESGERSPDADFLNRLCREFNINPTWILTGEGPMGRGEEAQGEGSLHDLKRRREDRFVDKFLAELDNYLSSQEKEEPGYRAWFRIECKKRFPELFKEKKQAETKVDKRVADQKIA